MSKSIIQQKRILTKTGGGSSISVPVSVANGGTGIISYTVGDLIYASGTTTLSKLSDVVTGNTLISGGVGVAPSWGKVELTTHVSGILPTANGGTAVNIASAALVLGTASATAGQLTLNNAASAFTQTLRGTNPAASIIYDLPTTAPTAGQVLQSTAPAAGVATLSWATAGGVAGSTTQVQFNDGGVQAGDADFTWNKTNNILTIGKTTNPGQLVFTPDPGNGALGVKIGAYVYLSESYGAASTILGNNILSRVTVPGIKKGITGDVANFIGQRFDTGIWFSTNITGVAGTTFSDEFTNLRLLIDLDGSMYIGNGKTNTSPVSYPIQATSGSGTNIGGASLTEAGGKGTGSGTPGTWGVKTSTTLGSGTTLQSLVSRLTISGGAVTTDASTATWADALDFVFSETTGTKIGTATTQKIGFWGVTPVTQYATTGTTTGFTANASANTLFNESTFTGDTGATAYTISDLVKALKLCGIILA